jgi:hypothetical protein
MSFLYKLIIFLFIAGLFTFAFAISYVLAPIVVIILILAAFTSNKKANKDETIDKNDDVEIIESKPSKYNKTQTFTQPQKRDYRKEKGIAYERHIGKRFEEKGDLVIYNGLIQDYGDGGVDLVVISSDGKMLNLIQCKNWNYRTIEVEDIQKIYQKLVNHNFDFLNLPIEQIKTHLHTHKDEDTIRDIITHARQNKNHFTIRKTLYIASEKVVDLEIGKHLTMLQPDIFRYEDMKIVVEKIR